MIVAFLRVCLDRLSGPFARVPHALSNASMPEESKSIKMQKLSSVDALAKTFTTASAIVSRQLNRLRQGESQHENRVVYEHLQDLSTRYRFSSSSAAIEWLQR